MITFHIIYDYLRKAQYKVTLIICNLIYYEL